MPKITKHELITAIHPGTGLETLIKKKTLWDKILKIHGKEKYKKIIWRLCKLKYDPVLVGIYYYERWENGKTC